MDDDGGADGDQAVESLRLFIGKVDTAVRAVGLVDGAAEVGPPGGIVEPDAVADEGLFFRIVRAAFAQRRKQLLNPLSGAL